MKKLFVCHFTGDDAEVSGLAEAFHLHGVPIWVDHEGGFRAGDSAPAEARRIIADTSETCGLLLYASPIAFTRDFINRIELHEATRRKETDKNFILIAVPRRMSFRQLSEASLEQLGEDISLFHSQPVRGPKTASVSDLRPQFVSIANMVLNKLLSVFAETAVPDSVVGINFCTRDYLSPSPDDTLDLDATRLIQSGMASQEAWGHVLDGLKNIKMQLRSNVSLPSLRIRGSKHLTAAFLIGRIFPPPTVREILTQQGPDLWSTRCPASPDAPLDVTVIEGSASSDLLFLEITATDKSVRDGVRRLIQATKQSPMVFLRMRIQTEALGTSPIDNAVASTMAYQVRSEVIKIIATRPIKEIHIFAAIPQGLATLIGHQLNATLPIQLYEFNGTDYVPSFKFNHLDTI